METATKCYILGGICQVHENPEECPFHQGVTKLPTKETTVSAQEVQTEAPDALPFARPVPIPASSASLPTLQVIGPLPPKAYSTDAGFDLPASDLVYLSPYEVRAVPTGIRVKIPKGYFGRIVPRSSAAKRGIEVIDGTIDAGYTGELFVMAKCTSDLCGELMVSPGQRIGQLILFPVLEFEVAGVEAFTQEEGERGENGFGSSGL